MDVVLDTGLRRPVGLPNALNKIADFRPGENCGPKPSVHPGIFCFELFFL